MYDRYADISRLHAWNLDFVENLPAGSRYREMCSKVDESLRFMKAIGVDTRFVCIHTYTYIHTYYRDVHIDIQYYMHTYLHTHIHSIHVNANIHTYIPASNQYPIGIKVYMHTCRSPTFTQCNFYTAHECLLLPYEQALTRQDSITNRWYDCSSHMLWVGERTRQLVSNAHAYIQYIHTFHFVKRSFLFLIGPCSSPLRSGGGQPDRYQSI